MNETTTIKCLLVGDSQIGKSSLLQTLASGKYPTNDFVPSYHDKCSFSVDLDENRLNSNSNSLVIELSDYDENTSLNLNDYNVVLLCFSFDSKSSFESIKTNWLNIVENFNKNLAKNSDKSLSYILVGLKSDLIDETCACATFQRQTSIRRSAKKGKIFPNLGDEAIKKVTYDNFEKYSKKIGAADYIEMSAKEMENEFSDKLNTFLENIYKSYYLSNNGDKRFKKFLTKFNNSSYSRLQSPIEIPPKTKETTTTNKQVESVKFKFASLLRRCKKIVFSCTSSRTADNENYMSLDRPSVNNNKLRSSRRERNVTGKTLKIINAESTVTLNIENDEVFY